MRDHWTAGEDWLRYMAEDGYASPDEVKAKASEWTNAVLECRTFGHVWMPLRGFHNKTLHYFEITQLCNRCTTERYMEISERGHIFASWYAYAEGYLSKGFGRIAGDSRDVLRVESIKRVFDISTDNRKEPRSEATRSGTAQVNEIERQAMKRKSA